MDSLWAALLPLIIGSAVVPVQMVINILLLKSPDRGLLKAGLYVGGMATLRLLQGLVFGFFLTGASITTTGGDGSNPIISTLLAVLGIILLIAAYKQWQHEDNPDAPPPKWLTMMDGITPRKAFGVGFVVVAIGAKFWAFTLSAIAMISDAQLSPPASILTYLLFIVLTEALLLIPISIRIIAPGHSTQFLDATSAWLTRNNRVIVIVMSLVFGVYFLAKGLGGLLP